MNKDKETEKMLRSDLKQSTGDYWSKIESRLSEDGGQPEFAPEFAKIPAGEVRVRADVPGRKKLNSAIALAAAAILILAALLTFFLIPRTGGGLPPLAAVNYLVIDINPSVQFVADKDGKVTSAKGLNRDARVLLFGREQSFNGLTLSKASAKLFEYSVEAGYIAVDKKNNAMLIAADAGGEKSSGRITAEVRKTLYGEFEKSGIYGVVITGVNDASAAEQAEALGVTVSKMRLVLDARKMGVIIEDSEIVSISVSEIYSRMEDKAEELEELVSEELKDRLEELNEAAEKSAETLAENIEELLERIKEFADGDDTEAIRESLEDTLSEIEDAAEENLPLGALFESLYDGIDSLSSVNPELNEMLDAIKVLIEREYSAYNDIKAEIDAAKKELKDEQKGRVEKNKDKINSHEKDEDFDELFEKWAKEAEKFYQNAWDELKAEWEKELDD